MCFQAWTINTLQPIICNFGLCHNIHLGLEHLINRREGRISNLSSHRFQKIPKMLSAWTSEVSPNYLVLLQQSGLRKYHPVFAQLSGKFWQKAHIHKHFWNNFYAMIACTFVKIGFTKNCGLKGKICQQHFWPLIWFI